MKKLFSKIFGSPKNEVSLEVPHDESVEEGNTHLIIPSSNAVIQQSSNVVRRRDVIGIGKWVVLDEQYLGIVSSVAAWPTCTVDLVDDKGVTVFAKTCNLNQLRLARFKEIPELRRQGLDPAYAEFYLGYK